MLSAVPGGRDATSVDWWFVEFLTVGFVTYLWPVLTVARPQLGSPACQVVTDHKSVRSLKLCARTDLWSSLIVLWTLVHGMVTS